MIYLCTYRIFDTCRHESDVGTEWGVTGSVCAAYAVCSKRNATIIKFLHHVGQHCLINYPFEIFLDIRSNAPTFHSTVVNG